MNVSMRLNEIGDHLETTKAAQPGWHAALEWAAEMAEACEKMGVMVQHAEQDVDVCGTEVG